MKRKYRPKNAILKKIQQEKISLVAEKLLQRSRLGADNMKNGTLVLRSFNSVFDETKTGRSTYFGYF